MLTRSAAARHGCERVERVERLVFVRRGARGMASSTEPMDIPARARPAPIAGEGGSSWETSPGARGDTVATQAVVGGEAEHTASPSPPFPPFSPPTAGAWGGARSFESSPMRWVPKRSAIRANGGGRSLLSHSLAQGQPSADSSSGSG